MPTYMNPNTFPVHPGAGAPIASGGTVKVTGDEEWLADSIAAGELVEVQDGAESGDDGDVTPAPRNRRSQS
jgi:hypothetical protein